MTRRHLFAALASLPFVGRFVKKPVPALPVVAGDCVWYLPRRPTFRLEGGRMTMTL